MILPVYVFLLTMLIILLKEYEKKNTDYLKNEASMKSEFLGQCRQLGIQGDHIKKELVERLKELPGIYEDVCWFFFHITALQIWSKIITFMWNWFTNKI